MADASYVEKFEQAVVWLTAEWDGTADVWGDGDRRDFEDNYWAPLSRANAYFLEQLEGVASDLERVRAEVP